MSCALYNEQVEKSRVPSLNRCLDILRYVQKHHKCTKSDIVSNLNIPRSSAYVLLDEMENLGLIKINGRSEVQLWMTLIDLGISAQKKLDLQEVITPHLKTLLESVDCLAVHFGIMDGLKAFYAIKLEAQRTGMSIKSREGLEISLVHAGIGKCILAYQEENKRERILKRLDYSKSTANSIDSEDKLRQELANIRLHGWAFDDSEGEESIRCVAAPVFHERKLLGAISIVGMVNKYTNDVIPSIVEKTLQCTAMIQKSLLDTQKK